MITRWVGFSAAIVALAPATGADVVASSSFDRGADGWVFPASTTWSSEGGNPGGFLLGAVEEPENITAEASAPVAFLGSWLALDGCGQVRFDYRRISNGGGSVIEISPLTVRIRGGTDQPGSVAVWQGAVIQGPSAWETFHVPINETDWSIPSGSGGTWSDILSNVTEMTIVIELVSNTQSPEDKNGIDNVVLESDAGSSPADLNGDCGVDGADLGLLLGAWGPCDGCDADLDGEGSVNGADLGLLLAAWTG